MEYYHVKEEYLSALRLIIRQQALVERPKDSSSLNSSCLATANFLYALAECRGDRSSLRALTLNGSNQFDMEPFRHEMRYPTDNNWNDYFRRSDRIRSIIAATQLTSVNWNFLTETGTQQAVWIGGAPKAHAPQHWDPRTESIPQSGFNYRYSRTTRTEDAAHDLQEKPAVLRETVEKYLKEQELKFGGEGHCHTHFRRTPADLQSPTS